MFAFRSGLKQFEVLICTSLTQQYLDKKKELNITPNDLQDARSGDINKRIEIFDKLQQWQMLLMNIAHSSGIIELEQYTTDASGNYDDDEFDS